MRKEERKLWNGILGPVFIGIILMIPMFIIGSVPGNGGGPLDDDLVFEWREYTGSDVLSVDISDGTVDASDVYVVAGSTNNLTVFDGDRNLVFYKSINVAEYGSWGNSHGVAISGNAQYIVAGDTSGVVHVYNLSGVELWSYDMGAGPAYSVDVSNPLKDTNNMAYVVSCCGDYIYVFDAASIPPVRYLWREQIANGTVINVRISEDGRWVAASSNDRRIEFYRNINPNWVHSLVWAYDTEDSYVNIDIGRTGLVVVAGDDDPYDYNTSNVYEFDAGTDWTWETSDDNTPRWIRTEPNDMYAVAVSDSEVVSVMCPPFSVISGETHWDDESEESYYYSSTKVREWATGLVFCTDATFDDDTEYNFRLFGTFDYDVILVAQDSNTIVDSYSTDGRVNSVAISYSFIAETSQHTEFDYFVAGSADGFVYFFTYLY